MSTHGKTEGALFTVEQKNDNVIFVYMLGNDTERIFSDNDLM